MDNDQGTDPDYDDLTSHQSQHGTGTDMDNTLENDENSAETPEHRPPYNKTNTIEDQNEQSIWGTQPNKTQPDTT